MSKARAIADNADFSTDSNLDCGLLSILQDGEVYSSTDTSSSQNFNGGTI